MNSLLKKCLRWLNRGCMFNGNGVAPAIEGVKIIFVSIQVNQEMLGHDHWYSCSRCS